MDCFFSKNSLNWKAVIDKKKLSHTHIQEDLIFWIPLAATWLMMATD
jgi:hypothetical protein